MTDEQGTRAGQTGFTQGLLSDSIQQTEQVIQEWFDELDYKKYGDAYLKLALSGTTGALEALGRQQEGKSSSANDPVDLTRFLADTWLSSMANAWDATRDLGRLVQKDFSRYVGVDTQSAEASSAKTTTKETAKPTTKGQRKR